MVAQNHSFYKKYTKLAAEFDKNQIRNNAKVNELISEAKINEQYNEASKIGFDYSLLCYKNYSYDDALKYAELSASIKEATKTYDTDYKDALFRAAYFSFYISEYEKSTTYYEKVIDLGIDSTKIAQSYCGIANNYFVQNDYNRSIDYYLIGIKKLEQIKAYQILSKQYVDLSNVYYEVGTDTALKNQLKYLKKAEGLKENIQIKLIDQLRINNGLATVYGEKLNFNFEKARYYSNKNIELSVQNGYNDYTCTSYNNLSNIYNLQKKDSALYFAEKALEICERPTSVSIAQFQKADYYKNLKNYDEALNQIQKGINLLIDKSLTPYEDLKFEDVTEIDLKYQIFFQIIEKNKLLKLKEESQNDTSYAKLALNHVMVTDSLIDHIQLRKTYDSKIHWRLKASEIYTQGIKLCHKLNQPETAFYLSEKGKALLLTENIINNRALTKLPDSIILKENTLKKLVFNSNSDDLKSVEEKLKYETYLDSLKMLFPQYYKNQSLRKIVNLEELKESMDHNSLIVSYFWPNKKLESDVVYGLFITKDYEKLLEIDNSIALEKSIKTYMEFLKTPFKTTEDKKKFNTIAFELHTKLLQPNETIIGNKNIIILPDGPINNLPFETLTKTKEDLDYLIKSNNISYAYSISFLRHNSLVKRKTKKQFTGFAPIQFNDNSLSQLENSKNEVEHISSIFDGLTFTNNSANKSSFLENAIDSKIIHLATHADASGDPWIAFADKKMNLEELFTFKNNAELTVLSSCNTSLGETAQGEGVMSLARGFFYSGSNSVVASLWTVNDKSTAFLMEKFYENLKKGDTKSQALRNAKLSYIASHSLSEVSPYYWSSFVLLGDTNSIKFTSNSNLILYIMIIAAILAIAAIIFKIKFRIKTQE